MKNFLLSIVLIAVFVSTGYSQNRDTLVVKTFSFDSITTRRGLFDFPDSNNQYGKILMYYTLKCDEATPHDKYPCGEWDYTTYTRIYQDIAKSSTLACPSFKVKNESPAEFYYSKNPTYRVLSYYENQHTANDYFLTFDGDDFLEIPSQALSSVSDAVSISFWLLGDASQPRKDVVLEALNSKGERIINVHVPYDNGVLYFDAGGAGVGNNDNINVKPEALYYKGVWTHYALTKNSKTGEQKIFRNGELIASAEDHRKSLDEVSTIIIGAAANKDQGFYRGSLDEIMIWDCELSPDQVKRSMYPDAWELPASENLLVWYPIGRDGHRLVIDKSGNQMHASLWGVPQVNSFGRMSALKPKPQPGQQLVCDSVVNTKVHIVLYDDTLNPQLPTDTMFVYPGYRYHYDAAGNKLGETVAGEAQLLQRKTRFIKTTAKEEEIFEIARFITPYGKRLDLGLNGFTWVYDVTDYAPLLRGNVDLQAGNGQELIDLRFLFIEGIPEKEPLHVRNVYPYGSHLYEDLSDDKALQSTLFRFSDDAEQAVIRARISGHGHAGPKNCCEWDPKTHYLLFNKDTLFHWEVWRDCGLNPVHPQGGTWQFDRAGWCPGTFVDTYDFPVPDSILKKDIALVDYAIEPYDPDNGEEKGNYEISVQILEYGPCNFTLDASLHDVLAPSDRHEYRRRNPVSTKPVVIVKNCGTEIITDLNIRYGMNNGKKSFFQWSGEIVPGKNEEIPLPACAWKKMKQGELFIAEIKRVNGKRDDNDLNNIYYSEVSDPVILPESFIIEVKTQDLGRSADNALRIFDNNGDTIFQRTEYPADTLVYDTISLARGAYTFLFSDDNEDGMIRHWWNYYSDETQVGNNGSLKLFDLQGNEFRNLGFDWAEHRRLNFFVGKPF